MNLKDKFNHPWHVWFKHGEGQATVYASTPEEAKREALAYCRKQEVLVDTRSLDTMIARISPEE